MISYPQLRKVDRDIERVLAAHTVRKRFAQREHVVRVTTDASAAVTTGVTGHAAASGVNRTAASIAVAGAVLVLHRVRHWRVRHRSVACVVVACVSGRKLE